MSFSKLPPGATGSITPFQLSIPQESIDELKTLLSVSKVAEKTYENSSAKEYHGITRDWLLGALKEWKENYDWRETESHINSFPNFKAKIQDGEGSENTFDVHFVALFSEKEDAVPLVMTHGWPGSFLEFLPLLGHLKSQYTPSNFPYHVIIPSVPGYTLSSGPPIDRDYDLDDVARLWNKLMITLGFGGSGYVTQGGDLGSPISQNLGQKYKECKAVHGMLRCCVGGRDAHRYDYKVNAIFGAPPDPAPKLSAAEEAGLEKNRAFWATGSAYAQEHATRPATIGFVLQSSPVALLSWIGEKFLSWTDEDPPLRTILDGVTLYWLTETIARCIYPYRALVNRPALSSPQPFLAKPFGFSVFLQELSCYPKPWAEKFGQLEFYREHESGGHFAALEKPKELWQDVDEFVKKVWNA